MSGDGQRQMQMEREEEYRWVVLWKIGVAPIVLHHAMRGLMVVVGGVASGTSVECALRRAG